MFASAVAVTMVKISCSYDVRTYPFTSPPCSDATKQKALYLDYELDPSLQDVPATDLSVSTRWINESAIFAYGSNGVFAAQPFGTAAGLGGYFGSQVVSNFSAGAVLFSIWDHRLPRVDVNKTWCKMAPNVSTESKHPCC